MAKEYTDNDIKRKAVKLVVAHIKKKLPEGFEDPDLEDWLEAMDELLKQEEFVINDYYDMRSSLNFIVGGLLDDNVRHKLRDSWFSFGKALNKKKKPK